MDLPSGAPLRTMLVERSNAQTAPVTGRASPAMLAPAPEGTLSTPFPGGTHRNRWTWGPLPRQGHPEAQDKSKRPPLLGGQPRRRGRRGHRASLLHMAGPRPGTQRKRVTGLRVCVPGTGARTATAHRRIMLLTEAPGPRLQPGPPLSLTGSASEAAGRPVLAHRCGRGEGGSIREVDRRRTVSHRRTQEGPALGEGDSRLRNLLPAPVAPLTERLGNGV